MTRSIAEKIEEYKFLRKSKKALEKRLAELRSQILPQLGTEPCNGLIAQQRDLTTFDEDKVWDIVTSRNLDMMKLVPDPDKIECLYLVGAIDDNDLRYIRVPKYSYALVEVEDVQELPSDVR